MTDEKAQQERAAQLRKPTGENGIATAEWMNQGNRQMNLDTIKVLQATEGDTILEIGMGNGFFVTDILSQHNSITYTGCDFSELMITESEKINEAWIAKGLAKFFLADVASLPFANNTFNKIFTVNTIYFWDNAIAVLHEIKRVLTTGGICIIALRPKHQAEKYEFTKYGFTLYSKEDLTELLTANGFNVIKTIENKEPDLEVNGEIFPMENLIVAAKKI
ncbi:class I SAM-dependent methyltransferase [Ferruginibacter lapsinanis]|uniref:class I SAM-dependent methyltransferase n=1 Tax=Ferruginibacter lapsinanis TaxID=563172 RepID=UPI001E4F8ED4|nr:class I SAM-dependent methyltransferase [Ferruginibacter lapsinanis]UEG48540.1 class I SAM-dependent methyltransferase [Ferruginibacter lapsinanis]